MGMLGRFRPRGGDSGTLARGDSSGLMPQTGGMGRPPGPPTRTSVGSYGDRPGRGAKDPGSLPQRPNPNQPTLFSTTAPALQADTWISGTEAYKPKPASKKKASEGTPSQAPSKISSYHARTSPSYQTTDE
jgi:hypothetical protein